VGFKVRFVRCNEGYSGDYNPADPEDQELLRIDVLNLTDDGWIQIENGSTCTNIPVKTPKNERRRLLKLALEFVRAARLENRSLKRSVERLSWLEPGTDFLALNGTFAE
jgi:hypothetical protein